MGQSQQPPPPEQARVTVFIQDHTGNKRREARVAATVPVRDLIPLLVEAMQLPQTDSQSRRVVYHLAFNNTDLPPDQTLAEAGIVDGASVTLLPQAVAGSGRADRAHI
jgi:hypothetical protein